MAKCERPCWTVCFVLIWLVAGPGLLLTHVSVGKLIPAISDLPSNLIEGFDAVFKFAYMEKDAKDIKSSATVVLTQCAVATPAETCLDSTQYPNQELPSQSETVNTTASKANITQSFNNSLQVVERVAKDKYLGTEGLNETVTNLNTLQEYMRQINTSMKCYVAVPVFCNLFNAANGIVDGMAQVNTEIDKFKKSDIVTRWDEYSSLLVALHGLPYILVMGMLLFSLFWLRGGVCCCCRGGTRTGFCLIFYVLLWLVSFVIYLVVGAVGVTIKYGSDRINVPVLKGNPTLKDAIEHLQTDYPEFWAVVFEDLEKGLDLLLSSSFFFIVAALLIALYSACLCCCRPYRPKEDLKQDS